MRIIFATTNEGKMREIRMIMADLGVGQSPSEEEELLRKKICTKLHRIARSLDAVADDL